MLTTRPNRICAPFNVGGVWVKNMGGGWKILWGWGILWGLGGFCGVWGDFVGFGGLMSERWVVLMGEGRLVFMGERWSGLREWWF